MAAGKQFYPNLRWQEFYAESDPVEVLILGSSHAYRSYEPYTLEAELGRTVFNMGSSAQSPITSYYLLREVMDRHRPALVILDLYFMVFTSDELLNNGLANWSYMAEGPARSAFFREGFSRRDQVAVSLFPAYVYRKYAEPKLKKLLGRSYLPPKKGDYSGKGFVGFTDTLALNILQNYNQFDRFTTGTADFTSRCEDYLQKIVMLCRSENIPLVFSVAPMPEISVEKIGNYPELSDHFRQIAASLEVPYWDYNRQRLTVLRDGVHYYDDDHMNLAGARLFSKAVARDVKNEIQ